MDAIQDKAASDTSGTSAAQADDDLVVRAVRAYLELVEEGQKPDRMEFAGRYPDIAPALAECLAGLDFVQAAVPELSGTGAGADAAVGEAEYLPVTQVLGDFRIAREVGRGGMGIVYEAEQISLGRRVALKVLPFAATMDPRHLRRFQNEARAAAGLHHTSIVPVYFVGCERGVHYYAMQFIEGKDLASVLADRRKQADGPGNPPTPTESPDAPAGQAAAPAALPGAPTRPIAGLSTQREPRTAEHFRSLARLAIQAAEALDHAHQLGIVHRDVKPANLLVDTEGRLWVTDFGLAHIQSDSRLTMTGDLVGTLRYMSPEQALAKRVVVDHRTDIYSLGATLYELLTLEPVFAGSDRQELLRQIAFEEPRVPRRNNRAIPAELETIVLKALQKNPTDRYATAQEMADDLHRFVLGEPIRARRPSMARRVRGWCRRHKQLVSGLGVLLVTLTIVGAITLWRQERQRTAIEQAVAEDLREADVWQGQEKWQKALPALERAAARLQGSGLEELQERVEKRRRELIFVGRLEKERLRNFTFARRETQDYSAQNHAYHSAFAENGLDLAKLPAEDIAQRIRASSIRSPLVRTLDIWAHWKDFFRRGDGESLRAIAMLADDDPWRRQLRTYCLNEDRAALEKLAEAEAVLDQPPENLEILFLLLGNAKSPTAGLNLLKRAQQQHPENFWLNYHLGFRLVAEFNKPAEAEAYCRAALAAQPEIPEAYLSLANALGNQGLDREPEAEAASRKAISLQPDNDAAYYFLGNGQLKQNKLPQAAAAFRKAIELNPKAASAFLNLGWALLNMGKLSEAEAAYRKVTELRQDHNTYFNLGLVLYLQARFAESSAYFKRAHELAEGKDFKKSPTALQMMRKTERFVLLEAKLKKLSKGDLRSHDAAEGFALSELCVAKHQTAAATRFFSEAVAADPKSVSNPADGRRYDAACAAALAGCGRGQDAAQLEPQEYGRFRGQALTWLRAELDAWTTLLVKTPEQARGEVAQKMAHWQKDADFAGVRGAVLTKLPVAERTEWQKLWQDVEELRKRAETK
jgi:serine/threonine protein kinase/Flp pilus assembly protein TadD